MASTRIFSRCSSPRASFNQVVMAMLKPSQSYSAGFIVDPYTGNIAQEMQFLSGEDRKKITSPILRLGSPWQPSKNTTANGVHTKLFTLLFTSSSLQLSCYGDVQAEPITQRRRHCSALYRQNCARIAISHRRKKKKKKKKKKPTPF